MNMKSITLVVISLILAGSAFAQTRDRSLSESSGRNASSQNTFAVTFSLAAGTNASSGAEINISYDPSTTRVTSLEGCLSGVPSAMVGDFTKCSNFKERGMVQILIADLTRAAALPANVELGFIEFSSVSSKASAEVTKAQLIPQDRSAATSNALENVVLEKLNY